MRRHKEAEAGASPVKIILAIAALGAIYWAWAIGPHKLEFSRVKRLTRVATAYWLNVDPDLNEVIKKLDYDLDQAMVTSIDAEDVEFERINNNLVSAYVYYEIEVKHPWDIIKPTILEFEFEHEEERDLTIDH